MPMEHAATTITLQRKTALVKPIPHCGFFILETSLADIETCVLGGKSRCRLSFARAADLTQVFSFSVHGSVDRLLSRGTDLPFA